MIYPVVSIDSARNGLGRRRRGEPAGIEAGATAGQGSRFEEERAESLLGRLRDLRDSFNVEVLPENRAKDFEGPASELVHSHLSLDLDAATDRGFWLWLTFVAAGGQFIELVDWRFGARDTIDEVNYGIGTPAGVKEGLFARLWLRGNIGYEEDQSDPYDIAKRGSVDLWRSHIIRVEYGRCAQLARALVRFQHPDSDPSSRTLSVLGIRELAKRLRIVDATLSYEVLDESQLSSVVGQNAELVRTAGIDAAETVE